MEVAETPCFFATSIAGRFISMFSLANIPCYPVRRFRAYTAMRDFLMNLESG
jgi:hypothetical protein